KYSCIKLSTTERFLRNHQLTSRSKKKSSNCVRNFPILLKSRRLRKRRKCGIRSNHWKRVMAMGKISPWVGQAKEIPVEMSSRIRLARNVRELPFPHLVKEEEMTHVIEILNDTLSDFKQIDLEELKFEDKALLVEKHLISPLFTKRGRLSYINEDESVSIMVN